MLGSRSMARTFLRGEKRGGHSIPYGGRRNLRGWRENYYNDNGQFAQKKTKRQFKNFLREQLRANLLEAGHYFSLAESLYPIFLALVGVIFTYSPPDLRRGIIAAIIDLVQRSIDPIKDVTGRDGQYPAGHRGSGPY